MSRHLVCLDGECLILCVPSMDHGTMLWHSTSVSWTLRLLGGHEQYLEVQTPGSSLHRQHDGYPESDPVRFRP